MPDVEIKDKARLYESREADLRGHIGNPLGGNEVSGRVVDMLDEEAASQPQTEKEKMEELSSRREPNPAKDNQLRKALDLVKAPAEWKKSLGLAASRPTPKKENSSE